MEGERVVLCHSLACLLWLLHARSGAADAAERVLLVAPPAAWQIPAVARFRADGVEAADVERAAESTLMFCGAPDPYCPGSATRVYGGVLSKATCVPGAGHVNTDAGYGAWPAVEQWALGERDDLVPN
jgi:predicted alpha/beta hydrolase family esterase